MTLTMPGSLPSVAPVRGIRTCGAQREHFDSTQTGSVLGLLGQRNHGQLGRGDRLVHSPRRRIDFGLHSRFSISAWLPLERIDRPLCRHPDDPTFIHRSTAPPTHDRSREAEGTARAVRIGRPRIIAVTTLSPSQRTAHEPEYRPSGRECCRRRATDQL